MRLSEVQYVLNTVDMDEKSLRVGRDSSNSNIYNIYNIKLFKQFVDAIKSFTFFEQEILYIKNSDLYSTSQDSISMRDTKADEIMNVANYLVYASKSLIKVLGVINSLCDDDNSIFIKLPCTNDFTDLINNLSEFNKSISQVITNEIIGGHLQIKRWESGSFWLELILGSQAAVALIASIAWSATVISKKYKESQMIEQYVKSLKIRNESLADLLEKQQEAASMIIQNEVKNIQVKHFGDDDDNEQFERLKMTTKTFAELIQKGSEVHPSLNAPEQVQNIFPNYKQLSSVVSQIKQIEGSSENC